MSRNRIIIIAVLGVSLALVAAGALLLVRSDDIPSDALLVIEVRDELPEESSQDMVSRVLGWKTLTVLDVVQALDAAARDPRVNHVFLSLSSPRCGLARAQELRGAIRRFRESGGTVEVVLPRAGITDYYVASAANRVHLVPAGSLIFSGLAVERPFLRGTLDTLGIIPDFERSGERKDAPDVYTRHGMSDGMRAEMKRLTRGLLDILVSDVAASRDLPPEEVRRLVDIGFFSAPAALDAGLVDDLLHAEQVVERLGGGPDGARKTVPLRAYLDSLEPHWWASSPKRVALVYATGILVSGDSVTSQWAGRMTGSRTLSRALEVAREDDRVAAVVLRIDSPGGSSVASELMWQAIKETQEKKPVVVSMGDYGASGGYYLAAAADHVIAQPATLTGSIGVFSGKFAMRGLWERIGMNWEVIGEGRNATMFMEHDPWDDEQRTLIRAQLDAVHRRFIEVVAEGRSIESADMPPLATGRVFTGSEAVANGLADRTGGLAEAVQEARTRAGISEDARIRVEVYPPASGWLPSLSRQAQGGAMARVAAEIAVLDRLASEPFSFYSPLRIASP